MKQISRFTLKERNKLWILQRIIGSETSECDDKKG